MALAQQDNSGDDSDEYEDLTTDEKRSNWKLRAENFLTGKFPTENNNVTRPQFEKYKEEVVQHMELAYPLVHGGALSLIDDFMKLKRAYGSKVEKELYKGMTMRGFLDRLARKRAVVFFKANDDYMLRNGTEAAGDWDKVGTDEEKAVKLADYMSYDELIISALCGISSPTHFVNTGERRNFGRVAHNFGADDCEFPKQGVYMGLVGARFEKSKVMEQALMAVDRKQNTKANGYGNYGGDCSNDVMKNAALSREYFKDNDRTIWRAFEKFYGRNFLPLFEKVSANQDDDEYLAREGWQHKDYLNRAMYRQRIRCSLELFLFDADHRAETYQELHAEELKKAKAANNCVGAFCHIVGLGTGVWSFEKVEQNRIIVQVAKDIIASTDLKHIDFVYFSWLTRDAMFSDSSHSETIFEDVGSGRYHAKDAKGHTIVVEFGQRAPADPLPDPFAYCLTVAMYAWDSCSFPGNEYWHSMLSASGDPAAAACSTIPFVQNLVINKERVNGKHSKVYFYDAETKQYEFHKMRDIDFEQEKEKWLAKSRRSLKNERRAPKGQVLESKEDEIDEALHSVEARNIAVEADQHVKGSTTTIRLMQGQKPVKVTLKKTATILDLYAHAKHVFPGRFRFVLIISGPDKTWLKDPKQTIAEAGIEQTVIRIQKL